MSKITFHRIPTDPKIEIRIGIAEPEGKARAAMLVFAGKGETIEKYQENIDYWNKQGYRVMVAEWRGQGGSTRQLADSGKVHVDDFGKYVSDAEKITQKFMNDPRNKNLPHVIFGQSMGGHVAERMLLEKPELQKQFDRIILSSPMVGLGALATVGAKSGPLLEAVYKKTDYAPFESKFDPATYPFAKNGNTSDRDRYKHWQDFLKAHPKLKTRGVTLGWLEEANKSMSHVEDNLIGKQGRRLDPKKTLMISGERDETVPYATQRSHANKLKIHVHVAENSKHEPFFEKDKIRTAALKKVDQEIKRAIAEKNPAPKARAQRQAGLSFGYAG